MKRSWDISQPLESASNQQRQQTIVEEKRHPCDTPTTPVASDRNVTMELTEDRHNDSGVSFCHSTPNASGLLTPICNQFSSSIGYDSLSVSTEHTHLNYIEALIQQSISASIQEHKIEQPTNMISTTTVKINNEDIIDPPKQCLLCTFITSLRSAYTDHVVTHFSLTNNPNTEALSESAQVTDAGPLCDDTWENAEEVEDIDLPGPSKRPKGATAKRKNKDARRKRCKECDFVTTSKVQYWIHLRTHINDNGYGCTSCPFVTKYKHHMSHHWFSMHDNLKLFHCTKCNYSCVSKSMLSSHMKTHSNIYQYNCGSCTYKTKFFNAIKKHLQDTMHKAGAILDTDGRPNPEATLDVFGNKRGPRCKPSARDGLNQNSWPSMAIASPSQTSQTASNAIAENVNGTEKINYDNANQNLSFPLVSYINEPAVNSWYNQPQYGDDVGSATGDVQYDNLKWSIIFNYIRARAIEKQRILNELLKFETDIAAGVSDLFNESCSPETEVSENTDEPLDLSMPDMNAHQQQQQQKQQQKQQRQFHISATYIPNVPESAGSKTKLEDVDEKTNVNQNEMDPPTRPEYLTAGGSGFKEENPRADDAKNYDKINSNAFTCLFCQIGFANRIMYYDHISYHSSVDPFTCNKCGSKCSNNVDFYVHLIKMKH